MTTAIIQHPNSSFTFQMVKNVAPVVVCPECPPIWPHFIIAVDTCFQRQRNWAAQSFIIVGNNNKVLDAGSWEMELQFLPGGNNNQADVDLYTPAFYFIDGNVWFRIAWDYPNSYLDTTVTVRLRAHNLRTGEYTEIYEKDIDF